MSYILRVFIMICLGFLCSYAQTIQSVIDIPTRANVTQRMIVLSPLNPKAIVVLFAGGHGGLQISPQGDMGWGKGNFLVRTSQVFAQQGFITVVIDAPSDRQSVPFLQGFRQTPDHVADVKAVISWLRENHKLPIWLVGTSRGTQSIAYVSTELLGTDTPDGIVLTSTILSDKKSTPVLAMPLEKIKIPVLVVHHEQDGCTHCAYLETSSLMSKLTNAPKKQLLTIQGGISKGDPCDAFAYHGFNGLENEVVEKITTWIMTK